jgi:hypothetical protein
MKGRSEFTKTEIESIKKLISEKLEAESEKQNGFRKKIRKIGFYYSDFSSMRGGYTVAFFESLIGSQQIKII